MQKGSAYMKYRYLFACLGFSVQISASWYEAAIAAISGCITTLVTEGFGVHKRDHELKVLQTKIASDLDQKLEPLTKGFQKVDLLFQQINAQFEQLSNEVKNNQLSADELSQKLKNLESSCTTSFQNITERQNQDLLKVSVEIATLKKVTAGIATFAVGYVIYKAYSEKPMTEEDKMLLSRMNIAFDKLLACRAELVDDFSNPAKKNECLDLQKTYNNLAEFKQKSAAY